MQESHFSAAAYIGRLAYTTQNVGLILGRVLMQARSIMVCPSEDLYLANAVSHLIINCYGANADIFR